MTRAGPPMHNIDPLFFWGGGTVRHKIHFEIDRGLGGGEVNSYAARSLR